MFLYEHRPRLTGQWNAACARAGKECYEFLAEQLGWAVGETGGGATTEVEFTTEMVLRVKPDVVVVATDDTTSQ